jgi:hypothetical protein
MMMPLNDKNTQVLRLSLSEAERKCGPIGGIVALHF